MKPCSVAQSILSTLVLASAQWSPSVPVDTRSLDEIYAAARQEQGPLVVNAGGDAGSQWDTVISAFQDRFPAIELNWTVDLSKYHDGRIDSAWYAQDESVDIALLQTLHDYPRWKSQNRLLYYKPANWEDLYASERDPDGAWNPTVIFNFGTVKYDTSKVEASEIPDDFADFTDPKWKGKLVLAYPNDDDAVSYLFSKLVTVYGFEWLEALKDNVQWVRGTHSPVAIIGEAHGNSSDPRAITFTTLEGTEPYWNTTQPSKPFTASMDWSQTIGIFASTQRPETAKLLVSWFTSDEFQQPQAKSGSYVPRASIDQGKVYLQNTSEYTGFREYMLQRDVVEWYKLRFEDILGTAQGPTPLEIYP